jgi:KDEL-tailed cysteine endopeptidase
MMSPKILVAALLVAASCGAGAYELRQLREEHNRVLLEAQENPLAAFNQWVAQNAKSYANDVAEYQTRFSVWLENLKYILAYNARTTSHWLHLNHLADLTTDEYRARLGYDNSARLARNRLQSTPFMYADVDADKLPTDVDWRAKKAVAEVKNQGQCGSCWAFATTGSVEGINAIVTGQLVSLSEQELVDCDTDQDKGCSGGLMDYAYEFIIKNKGIDTEEDYPYTAMDGECIGPKKNRRVVTIDSYQDVPENDEVALKKAAAHQPIAVAIEADAKSFQLYGGGVYDDPTCGTSLNHGVLVAGYGKDPQFGNYWIVKNSWSPEWGDNGYIRLRMGSSDIQGMCGIAMAPSFPIKKGPNPPTPGPTPGPKPGPKPGPTPPSPHPVKCDDDNECPAGSTCCCVSLIFNLCFQVSAARQSFRVWVGIGRQELGTHAHVTGVGICMARIGLALLLPCDARTDA